MDFNERINKIIQLYKIDGFELSKDIYPIKLYIQALKSGTLFLDLEGFISERLTDDTLNRLIIIMPSLLEGIIISLTPRRLLRQIILNKKRELNRRWQIEFIEVDLEEETVKLTIYSKKKAQLHIYLDDFLSYLED